MAMTLTPPYNDAFTKLMQKLYSLHMAKGQPFRANAYKKAQDSILLFDGNISSVDDLKGKKGIGQTIYDKLSSYVETGTLPILERAKNDPVLIFTNVYGIGPKKAKELVEKHNIQTIKELRENKQLLNDKQLIGLEHYEVLLKRIPRHEIDEFKQNLDDIILFKNITDLEFKIVGSYRRGCPDSGDIDVILTSKTNNKDLFNTFLDTLNEKGLITHFLSRGPHKSLVIGGILGGLPRRVDFLYSSPEEYPFALLYFTGSAGFNTKMRHIALQNGLTLNEHGFCKMVGKVKGEKLDKKFSSEKDIFDFLNMEYKTPLERQNGSCAVVSTIQKGGKKKGDKESVKSRSKKMRLKIKHKSSLKKSRTKKKNKDDVLFSDFSQKGISFLQSQNEKTLVDMIAKANSHYYNETPILSDEAYDILKEYVEEHHPQNKILREIGAPIDKKSILKKETLPYFMGSMDKIKPDSDALKRWLTKYSGPFVISCKLDGISALYSTENGEKKLYTRGNGKVGQNISHLISLLDLPDVNDITVRGELIIKKTLYDEKYSETSSNSRNFVSGIINRKALSEEVKDIDFVAYEVVHPTLKPSKQMKFLLENGFNTVFHEKRKTISNDILSQVLQDCREKYEYEIDGIIVTNNKIYLRKHENPKHSFAFKMVLSDQVVESKVVDVLWSPSKDGYLKPRVQIQPVVIGGAKIEYATAFNGAFVEKNGIGIGAVIQLIRSGDVIPHIQQVIKPAAITKMPTQEYEWTKNHVDIKLVDMDCDETVREKNIVGFFTGLGVTGLSTGNIRKIMKTGHDTIPSILSMDKDDFLEVDGFKEKMATKVHNSIHDTLEKTKMAKLMAVSNLFGRGMGEKRIQLVLDTYPSILTSSETKHALFKKLAEIKGFGDITAMNFIENIDKFTAFLNDANLTHKLTEMEKMKNVGKPGKTGILSGKTFVLTGFRDKELERNIESLGGKLSGSVSKNTHTVIVKDMDETTGKAEKARKLGVPLVDLKSFMKKICENTK